MNAPSSAPKVAPARSHLLTDGILLTAANLVAAGGNYLFQAVMRRHLPWSEFGYLNATLSVILFAGVPLTAASQALTHHIAQFRSGGSEVKLARLEAASLKYLGRLTWILFALGLVLFFPFSRFLHFPRLSLAWIAALWIPVSLWSALGGAWCTGLGRFRLLSLLVIATAVVRLAAGAVGVGLYPWAEAGVVAGILSAFVLAAVAPLRSRNAETVSLRELLDRDLLAYGAAALAVAFGSFAFLQGDQMIAQRQFPGDLLGRYSGAGLLGRTVVWASLPVLTVYFTRRSGNDPAGPPAARLLLLYGTMVLAGAGAIIALRVQLLHLLLNAQDGELAAMTARFALAMVPVGALQALGCHCLAARRVRECLVFGCCALVYLVALDWLGRTPALMLETIGGGAATASALVGAMLLARVYGRAKA